MRLPNVKTKNIYPSPFHLRRRALSWRASHFVSTAIEYPDGRPHLGHAYEKILADIQARYFRLRGHKVLFTLGMDEHSQKVVDAAAKEGLEPLAYCNALEDVYRDAWERVGVAQFDFIRTSSPLHRENVRRILQRLYAQGDIYPGTYWHRSCPLCLPEQKVHIHNGKCKTHGVEIERRGEETFFFRTSKYTGRVLDHIEANPAFVAPDNYRETILHQVRQDLAKGVEDYSISRTATEPTWGIPFPESIAGGGNPPITYVWFDALIHYLTVSGYGSDQALFDRFWPPRVQVVGQDIVRHHAILWPTILLALDLPLPQQILVHSHILDRDRKKLSKSEGNGLHSLDDALGYGRDPLRYYLARDINPAKNSEFSPEKLAERLRVDLTKKYGHLLPWVEELVENETGGVVPQVAVSPPEEFAQLLQGYNQHMESHEVWRAALLLLRFFTFVSAHLSQRTEKRKLRGEFAHDQEKHLRTFVELLRLTALAAWPFIPESSEETLRRLGIDVPIASDHPAVALQWNPGWQPTAPLHRRAPIFSLAMETV